MKLYNKAGSPLHWTPQADLAWKAAGGDIERIRAQANESDATEVMLDTPIFDEYGVVDVVRGAIKAAGKDGAVTLLVNSPGGSVFTGVAVKALLDRHPGPVNVEVLGVAASAAQYITLAASPGRLELHPDSMLMIHQVQAFAFVGGTYEEITKQATALTRPMRGAEGNIRRAIAARMRLPQKRVQAMLEAETWFTAKEAVEARLADRIIRNETDAEPAQEDSGTSPENLGLESNRIGEAVLPSPTGGGIDVAVLRAIDDRLV